ncbi:MAG: hypothetical protein J6J71_00705 [Prevotella sp.]|nr:hypothetical protein [Prevotella sp.]
MLRRLYIKWLVWKGKAVDIWSKSDYPADVLSNLCSNGFRFEGMVCGSMEGFLQSLKQKDKEKAWINVTWSGGISISDRLAIMREEARLQGYYFIEDLGYWSPRDREIYLKYQKLMTQTEFRLAIEKHSEKIEKIRQGAHQLHKGVNQTYDKIHPYGFHLDMVADSVYKYGHEVCACEQDVLPLFFAAYYHDSIEDARLTYNDVTKIAKSFMDDSQAYMAAEIVYALTNDKGRTRAERAGEKYYQGIRETPYAPFIKLADRLANISYSSSGDNAANLHMKEVYRNELPHFLEALTTNIADRCFRLPSMMVTEIKRIISE